MPRIRTVKPQFWSSPNPPSRDARLLFLAMINFADDDGRGRANPKELAAFAFPYDDDIGVAELRELLRECSRSYHVVVYEVSGRPYFCIENFRSHQVINKPTASKLPEPAQAERLLYQKETPSVDTRSGSPPVVTPVAVREGYHTDPGSCLPTVPTVPNTSVGNHVECLQELVTNSQLLEAEVVALSGTELAVDDSFELATSERGLPPPVKVGASRLVATIIRQGMATDADRTILRLKASELLATESEDDVADCLRLWLTKTELGAHGLPLCMAEVLKRKHNGIELRGADKKAAEWLALGKEHNDKR
jgi:hypothetical protein